MALMGLPAGSNGNEEIKPRIQFDAKGGVWQRVDRHQNASGEWVSEVTDMETGSMFLMDLANIEVGWLSFGPPPDFKMVPNGQPVGPRPSDAYKAGFRVHVVLPREEGARVFASTAKACLGAMDELHTAFEAAPESKAGQVPVFKVTGRKVIETKTPKGTLRNYAPMLEVVKWVDRPAALATSKAREPEFA